MRLLGFAAKKACSDTPKSEIPQPKKLGFYERDNIRLLDCDMRSFYRLAKKFEKIPEPKRNPEDTKWIVERAQQLHSDYKNDQRDGAHEEIIGNRSDLAELYDEKREKMAKSVGHHMIFYESVAAVVTAATKGKAWAWAFGTATAASVVEFIIRNSFIVDRKQDMAENGWRKVVEYAAKNPAAEAAQTPAAEQKVISPKHEKEKRTIKFGKTEYAD